MNAALNELGSQLLGWFGQLSIELAALAVLVLVACHLLPIKSPALRHLLWAIVLLKPLVSVAISSPYTLFTPLVSLVESSRDAFAALPVEHPTMQVVASPTIATSSVQLTLAGWGAILWIVGAALLIGRILIGYGIVWRLRQQAQVQHDGPLCDALRQARRTLDGYPKVEVATSPSISSPMALGILRPIIVFPADLVEKLSTDKLALVLMHELAHVRRWDNLTMLLHRLVSAVLFFHPAVWLCGRMLRREAEQACDDLVVCATGRSEAYARGLAHVAERAAHFNPLMRRIPTMNAFAATESDLALRIRRALGGGARRMGTRARVLAVVLLCPLAAVTLPSYGNTSEVAKGTAELSQDERLLLVVDQDGNMELNDKSVTFATLKEELQAKRQLLDNTAMINIQHDYSTPQGQIIQIMDIARQVGIVDQIVCGPTSEVAKGAAESSRDEKLFIVVDQDGNMKLKTDKSVTFATLKEELQAKRQLLDNNTMIIIHGDERTPHGQIVQIMDTARQVGLVDQAIAAELQPEANVAGEPSRDEKLFMIVDQDGNMKLNDKSVTFATLKEELQAKRQLLDNTTIIIQHDERAPRGQILQIMDIAHQVGLVGLVYQVIATEQEHGIWQEAMATDPDEWSEELKVQLLVLEPDSTIEEIAEVVRQRRLWRKTIETDPDRRSDELKTQLLVKPGSTTIPFEITATAASAELAIYNAAGQPVRTFVLGQRSPGKYHIVWDGRDDAGRELSNGMYFYTLQTDAEATDKPIFGKTILVK